MLGAKNKAELNLALLLLGSVVLLVLMWPAKSHHALVFAPAAKVLAPVSAAGGSSAGAAVMGGGLAAAGAVIAWCGANQPKRGLRDTYVDSRHDVYPTHRYGRKKGCMNKDKKTKDPVKVFPSLWPMGK